MKAIIARRADPKLRHAVKTNRSSLQEFDERLEGRGGSREASRVPG